MKLCIERLSFIHRLNDYQMTWHSWKSRNETYTVIEGGNFTTPNKGFYNSQMTRLKKNSLIDQLKNVLLIYNMSNQHVICAIKHAYHQLIIVVLRIFLLSWMEATSGGEGGLSPPTARRHMEPHQSPPSKIVFKYVQQEGLDYTG